VAASIGCEAKTKKTLLGEKGNEESSSKEKESNEKEVNKRKLGAKTEILQRAAEMRPLFFTPFSAKIRC